MSLLSYLDYAGIALFAATGALAAFVATPCTGPFMGAALGAAVNPFAALIAFVDPGDAQSAACGPVLAGASAAAQRTSKGEVRKELGTGKSADVKKQKKGGFLGLGL